MGLSTNTPQFQIFGVLALPPPGYAYPWDKDPPGTLPKKQDFPCFIKVDCPVDIRGVNSLPKHFLPRVAHCPAGA